MSLPRKKIHKKAERKTLENRFFFVDEVYATRKLPNGTEQCFVSWVGYPPAQNSWVNKQTVMSKSKFQRKKREKKLKKGINKGKKKKKIILIQSQSQSVSSESSSAGDSSQQSNKYKLLQKQIFQEKIEEESPAPLFLRNHNSQFQKIHQKQNENHRKFNIHQTVDLCYRRKELSNSLEYSLKILPSSFSRCIEIGKRLKSKFIKKKKENIQISNDDSFQL